MSHPEKSELIKLVENYQEIFGVEPQIPGFQTIDGFIDILKKCLAQKKTIEEIEPLEPGAEY